MPSTKNPGANLAFLAGLSCTALVFPPYVPTYGSDDEPSDAADDWAALASDWERVGLDLAIAVDRVVRHVPIGVPSTDRAAAP